MNRSPRLPWILLALAVLVAPATLADTYYVYSDGGIPPAADLFTWCDAPPCDVTTPVSCVNPEGGASLRVQTNVWAGFGVFLPETADLSAFENGDLSFFVKSTNDLKVEFSCVPDPIGNPAGQTQTLFMSNHGWSSSPDWQEITIPICDFFPGGCDAQAQLCLQTVSAPFLSTIENLPFFNGFNIDYVRWKSANNHTGASSVQVQGRQLLVGGEPFVVNGVAYAPISIGENWQGAWRDRPDRYLVDFPLIAASGANTVRLYAPLLSTPMLDAAWANGLYVIPTYNPSPEQLTCPEGRAFMQSQFLEMVNDWKGHPSILYWLVGNEVNINLGAADLCTDWYPQLDAMAAAAHGAEGSSFHPVSTGSADVADVCVPGCSDDLAMPNLDLWSTQIYRGCTFGSTFSSYASKANCDRPLVLTEFGSDAYDSLLGAENETMQSSCLGSLLDEADLALAVRTAGGVSSGQVIFAWADEWWKANPDGSVPGNTCVEGATDWATHDSCTSFINPLYPDPAINEEWWGIVTNDVGDPALRGQRTAYDRVEEAYRLGEVCNLDVTSYDIVSGNTSLVFEPAPGSAAHTLHYGPLGSVSSYAYSGSVSGLGATGSSSVTLPAGSLFWVIAPENGGAEGCYGADSSGNERPGGVDQTASRVCQCASL